MTEPTSDSLGKIAVIGLTGRYPAARNLEQFWENLKAGKDCITFFTDDELIAAGVDRQLRPLLFICAT
jgi:polyketide synthase PksJ